MYYEYYIAMPTRGRVNKQSTLNKLTPDLRKYVNVYCHPGELLELSSIWGGKWQAYKSMMLSVKILVK